MPKTTKSGPLPGSVFANLTGAVGWSRLFEKLSLGGVYSRLSLSKVMILGESIFRLTTCICL